jgi:sigma-B regulation protein RsbU (phosphoserine phosphatase)
MERLSSKQLRILLGVIAVLAAISQLEFSVAVIRDVMKPQSVARDPFFVDSVPDRIRVVQPEAAAAGLKVDDRIRAVNGVPHTGVRTLSRALAAAKPGDVLRVETQAGTSAAVTLRALDPNPNPWLSVLLYILVPAGCLLLGVWVTYLRPRDARTWILLALLLSFSGLFLARVDVARSVAPLFVIGVIFRVTLPMTWSIWMVLLGLRFPERLPAPRWFHHLGWALMVVPALSAVMNTVFGFARAYSIERTAALLPLIRLTQLPSLLSMMLGIGFYFAAVSMHRAKAQDPDRKRRVGLLMWGSHVSFSLTFVFVLRAVFTQRPVFDGAPAWTTIVALLLLALFPVTLAYIVIVERALDARVMLRMGMQYALARRALTAVQAIIGFAVGVYVLDHTTKGDVPWLLVLALAGFAIVLQPLSRRLNQWLDRRFFRDAYDADHILSDLSEQVKSMVEAQPLLETVALRISEALHVPNVAMMLRGTNGAYEPAFSLGYATPGPMAAFAEMPLVGRLQRFRQPMLVLEPSELPSLNPRLLLPLGVKEELLGFISLGEKLSQEPYSPADLRLLKSVATQTGLALENARLTSAVAHQLAQREQFDKEMSITRDVQQRLFPQKLPVIEGLVYDGHCRPAQSVGGDYYDFVQMPGGELLLAVGDVSGKGMPAALLMAALQASVRGQALNNITDLEVFTRNVNLLLYGMSPKSHFATLFLGLYDPRTWRLRYTLAGHNPPLLLRSNGQMDFLKTTGPGVGMTRLACYKAELLQMDPGDLLVAYTDGFTEAMNAQRDEFGELRLMDAVRSARRMEPRVVIDRAIEAVDVFTAGAPQHDDMTMVVLEVR